jgi:muconolactone delta-isomerase
VDTNSVWNVKSQEGEETKMRFLVTTWSKQNAGPEMLLALAEPMIAWAAKLKKAGKIEVEWSNAGKPGGGAIINVNSLEELNQIMAEMPFGAISKWELTPIIEMETGIRTAKAVIEAMMAASKKGQA